MLRGPTPCGVPDEKSDPVRARASLRARARARARIFTAVWEKGREVTFKGGRTTGRRVPPNEKDTLD